MVVISLCVFLNNLLVSYQNQSGLTVHAEKGNGVVVKSIIRGGVVQTDGRLAVGDYITAVNNLSIRNHSNQEARSLIRRCSLEKNDIRYGCDICSFVAKINVCYFIIYLILLKRLHFMSNFC